LIDDEATATAAGRERQIQRSHQAVGHELDVELRPFFLAGDVAGVAFMMKVRTSKVLGS
jgi:hypothetical protein